MYIANYNRKIDTVAELVQFVEWYEELDDMHERKQQPMGTVRYSYLTQHIFVAEDDSQFFIVKRLTEDGYKFEEANTGFSDQDGGIYVYDGSLLVVTATGHLEDVLDTARLLKPVLPLTTPVFLSVTGVEDGYEIDQDRTRDHHVKVHELYKAGLTPANYSQLVTMA